MPHLILRNAKILPENPEYTHATAVAVRGNRIVAVGSDEEIGSLAKQGTRQIDLGGRLLLPGFTDSHIHLFDHAMSSHRIALADTTSLDDLLQRLQHEAAGKPPGSWIQGRGWNETRWPDPMHPTRQDLDRAAPDHPVILWRSDMHLAVVNSAALSAAGIDRRTPDPEQGRIDRDARGDPSGGLRERAIRLVKDLIPLPPEEQVMQALQDSFAGFHHLGVTGVHDFRDLGGREAGMVLRALTRLDQAGKLELRTWMCIAGEHLEEAIAVGLRTGFGNDLLRIGHVKYFSDGSQGAHTAWMLEPYLGSDDPGMPLTPMEEIAEAVPRAHQAGLAVAVHAIGDRANQELMAVFERAIQNNAASAPSAPHRIEHVQNIRPEDVKRMAALGVAASVQPIHLVDDITLVDQTVGERGRFTYPFRGMLDAGVVMAFGSDAPVADHNPLLGIQAAVTRQRQDGTPAEGWYPQQRLTVAEAIQSYTQGPAAVCGRALDLGTIGPGSLADLVVLEEDILSGDPGAIGETKIAMTVFNGRVVHER
ncbi:MAG TPA: amidohydrolase [Anaerolineae bacterium]|nr:amidohydrolase [Anaerolineae bacterium]